MASRDGDRPIPRPRPSLRKDVVNIDERTVRELTDYFKSVKMLKDLERPTKGVKNLDEAKEKLLEYIWERDGDSMRVKSAKEITQRVIAEDVQARAILEKICDEVKEHVTTLPKQQKVYIKTTQPSFKTEITQHREKLRLDGCTILVSGEVSSGKSSLLNLLLGVKMFPMSHMAATSTICEIKYAHNQECLVAHSKHENFKPKVEYFTGDGDEDAKLVDKYTRQSGERVVLPYKKVEVFLKSDWLKSGLVLVDSPGVGESDDLTKEVLQYMSNASGFLYVLNSANPGIQDDRLKVLVKHITRDTSRRDDVLACQSTMFVCNKWDRVPVEEAGKYWEHILRELGKIWPELSEDQVFKMNTKEALHLSEKKVLTQEYRDMLEGIEALMLRSLRPHKLTVINCVRPTLMASANSLKAAIVDSTRSKAETEQCIKVLRKQLTDLEHKRKEILGSLELEYTNQKTMAVEAIVEHFENASIKKRLVGHWTEITCPDALGDAEGLRTRQEYFVNKLFRDECAKWEKEHKIVKTVQMKLIDLFKTHFIDMSHHLDSIHQALTQAKKTRVVKEVDLKIVRAQSGKKPKGMSTAAKVGITVAFPLLLPIGMVAGVVMGVTSARKAIKNKNVLSEYKENKAAIMGQLTEEMLPFFRKYNNIECVVQEQLQDIRAGIFNLIETTIPNIIAADTELLDDLMRKKSSKEEDLKDQLQPRFAKCMQLLARLDLYQISYAKPVMIEPEYVEWEESGFMGESYCGRIYSGTLLERGCKRDVTLRVLSDVAAVPDTASAIIEEDNLFRKVNHHNVMPLKGTVTKKCDSKLTFAFLFDGKPTGTLRQLINSPDFSPAKQSGVEDLTIAAERMRKIMQGICGALFHLHQLDGVHGNVNPDGVLVFEDTARLAELGFLEDDKFQGADEFFLCYSAPEVIQDGSYTPASDVYCLGLVAWEMWYGKSAAQHLVSLHGHVHLEEALRGGARPTFESPQPPKELKQLIEDCWGAEQESRPTLQAVAGRIGSAWDCSYA